MSDKSFPAIITKKKRLKPSKKWEFEPFYFLLEFDAIRILQSFYS